MILKYTAKLCIILIGVLGIISLSSVALAGEYWITFGADDIDADGYATSAAKFEDQDMQVDYYKRGYLEFNISAIPEQATILQVSLFVDFYANGGWSWPVSTIKWCGYDTVRPSTDSDADIWDTTRTIFYSKYGDSVTGWFGINGTWTEGDINQHVEDRLSNGWYAFGFYLSTDGGNDGYNFYADHNSTGHTAPELKIKYEVTSPILSNEVPDDYTTEVNLSSTLSIDIEHPTGSDMNITWYWYNTSSSAYEEFDTNNTCSNGTYTQLADFATTPYTEYTWWIHVEDVSGNYTNAVYTFTTHCVNPPTSLECSSPTTTSINISFIKKPSNNGTTYTIMRYQHGGFPPSWTGGTFGENTTNSSVNTTGLEEGQCYAFSFWTNWQSADGDWYRSTDANQIICCVSGGEYRICLFDEETEQALNFSNYPYNLSTFVLRTHYYDNTEDDFFIYGDNATGSGGVTLYDCAGKTCFNVSAVNVVWYFELICFYDFNTTGLYNGLDSRSPYSRKLTPNIAFELECGSYTVDTLYFYVANRQVYGANYFYESDGNITQTQDNDFAESVVEYEYYYTDETGNYLSEPINTVYVSFYEPSVSDTKIIHQEYIDASRVTNPFLLYGKDYIMGIYSEDDYITNIGIAPTSMNLQPRITISGSFVEEYVFGTVNVSISRQGNGTWINITYLDSDYATQNVTFMLYEPDDTLSSSVIKYSSNTYHNFTGLSNDSAYYIIVAINKTFDFGGTDTVFYASSSYFLSALIDYITTASYIDSLITGTIGTVPFGDSWSFMVAMALGLLVLLGTLPFTGPAGAFIASGSVVMVINVFVYGLNPITSVVAIMLITFGFIIAITQRRNR